MTKIGKLSPLKVARPISKFFKHGYGRSTIGTRNQQIVDKINQLKRGRPQSNALLNHGRNVK